MPAEKFPGATELFWGSPVSGREGRLIRRPKGPFCLTNQSSENGLSGAPKQRDWTLSKEQNPNREKARAIRARQRAIGRELRRMYDDIAQEPVPDEFLDLLKQIDDAEGLRKKKSS